jgi:hypothetical protein
MIRFFDDKAREKCYTFTDWFFSNLEGTQENDLEIDTEIDSEIEQ